MNTNGDVLLQYALEKEKEYAESNSHAENYNLLGNFFKANEKYEKEKDAVKEIINYAQLMLLSRVMKQLP